jgi:putative phosphoesterase
MRIGLISDTHGLLRPEAIDALKGVDRILHAGDIGTPEVLAALAAIAPVTAVRGNNDTGPWARRIAETEVVTMQTVRIYMLHDLKQLDTDPAAEGFAAVIAGHSHKPKIEDRNGVLFVNPGSAGPRRFKLPLSVGYLDILHGKLSARIRELAV